MKTPFHLDDKIILVTGASSGIGRQVAISISRMGGTCIISGRNEEALSETLGSLEGKGHISIAADLLDETGRKRLLEQLPATDGLVHCAGNVKAFPIRFLDQVRIDEMMKLNFDAAVLLTAGLLKNKKLKRDASLVYLSSISSKYPPKGGSMYGSAKAALETFVKTLAQEIVSSGMRANSISPGMVKTPLYDRAEAAVSKAEMDEHMKGYPLGAGLPEDIANAAIYLLSPASRWVTGINIILDGGFLSGG
ncbi:MAG TPA: SDR family oxidoreductase [Bacteroidia bacterium]|nr:SDR family oxidoreductase [Bacteroidia bacterium]